MTIPIPRSTADLINGVDKSHRHPGLQLDKYMTDLADQKLQKPQLLDVVTATGSLDAGFAERLSRHRAFLSAAKVTTFEGQTNGPLTLHLSRASAFENAGLCLHPLHGFAYLPGSGLKGLARAYAETVWLASRPAAERSTAFATIEKVFGFSPGSNHGRHWVADLADLSREESQSGAVVFHDAWPTRVPRLTVDVVNSHHAEYYRDEKRFPLESETPNLVYFLAIEPGTEFLFGLAARRRNDAAEPVAFALAWLKAGLAHLGAGAKTGAGYGRFALDVGLDPAASRRVEAFEVELVTPAFLAGANQKQADATLRGATVKGLMRHWWRTMHSGFLTAEEMHRLESLVFGDTKAGGAVAVSVSPVRALSVQPFDRKTIVTSNSLPKPTGGKTSQGLAYGSYGTDDSGRQRQFVSPGARWRITLSARDGWLDLAKRTGRIPAEVLLGQARAALALLVGFGAVGSKSKKGFGSLQSAALSIVPEEARTIGRRFRDELNIRSRFDPNQAWSPSLENMLVPLVVNTEWANPWVALDQYGTALQAFAQLNKHKNRKKALGMPRNVKSTERGGPRFPDRHASPVQVHFSKRRDVKLDICIWMFPSNELQDSGMILEELRAHLSGSGPAPANAKSLPALVRGQRDTRYVGGPVQSGGQPRGQAPTQVGGPPNPATGPAIASLKAGALVDVTIIADTTKKGGRMAREPRSGAKGPITGIDVSLAVGSLVKAVVVNCNEKKEATFRKA